MKSLGYVNLMIVVVVAGSFLLVAWSFFRPSGSPETMVQVIVARTVKCQEAREISKGPNVPLVIIDRETFTPLCLADLTPPVHLLRTDKAGGSGDSLILTDKTEDGKTRMAVFFASTLEIR